MKRYIIILFTIMVSVKSYAQDVEQLAKADPVAVSGGLTASGIYINHLQGRSLAFSNDVGKSLRRTRVQMLNVITPKLSTFDETKNMIINNNTSVTDTIDSKQ